MFFRTTAGSGEWNSHVVPSPPILMGDASNRAFTAARSVLERLGSTPCLWVVRNSTASNPASVRFAMIVGISQSFAML
jgi:hypothetical protein